MRALTTITLALTFFISSCANLGDDDKSVLEAELLALLEADEALLFDGFDDEGDEYEDYQEGIDVDAGFRMMGDTLLPSDSVKLRFGRRIDRDASTRDITFETNGDTSIGTIAMTLVGTFYVKAFEWIIDSTTTSTGNHTHWSVVLVDSFSKDFTSEFTRKVRFVQVEDSNNPDGYSWKIDAFTMGVGGAGTKLNITAVNFYDYSDSSGSAVLSFTADENGEIFFDRNNLPTFTHSYWSPTTYRVEVTITNDDPILIWNDYDSGEIVSMHYGQSRRFKARRRMSDGGLAGDVTAGDNVFTRKWRPHRPRYGRNSMIARMFFSAVDNNTLFVSDGGFNTSVWMFPYKVVRE